MEIDGRTLKGKHNDYIAERMTSRMTYSKYIQDQQTILQLWAGCHQGAKKLHFTACHSGKQQLACTSPQVISTSPKPFLISRIDYNPSVNYLNFPPPKSTCPWGTLKKITSLIAKSTSPGLTDTTFFARCVIVFE